MITSISELLLDQGFTRSQRILSKVNQVLALAENSISTITTETLSRKCTSVHWESRVKHWNDKLSKLTVQNKITDITELESQNNVWKRSYPERNACWTAVISAKGQIRHTPYSPKLAMMEIKARLMPSALSATTHAHIKWLPCISRTRKVYLATWQCLEDLS